jgi:hypothetical protein
MYIMAHIYKDKYGARLHEVIEKNKTMSVHTMVLKLEACIFVVNQDQAFGARFFK